MEDIPESDYQKPINDSYYLHKETSNYNISPTPVEYNMFSETNNNVIKNTTPINYYNKFNSIDNKLPIWKLIVQLILCFILITIAIIEIIIQINNDCIKALILGDDIAILGISLVFLFFNFQRRKLKKIIVQIITLLMLYYGFFCKIIGTIFIFSINKNLIFKIILLNSVRTFFLSIYLNLISCKKSNLESNYD